MEGFELTDGHGLVLHQVEVDHVAEESIDTDECEHLPLLVH
jgi:hypothetical protein